MLVVICLCMAIYSDVIHMGFPPPSEGTADGVCEKIMSVRLYLPDMRSVVH